VLNSERLMYFKDCALLFEQQLAVNFSLGILDKDPKQKMIIYLSLKLSTDSQEICNNILFSEIR